MMAIHLMKYHLKSLQQQVETFSKKENSKHRADKFEEIKANLERVDTILEEVFQCDISVAFNNIPDYKNDLLALWEQVEGNAHFGEGMYTVAFESYSKCIARAESKEVLALSYANRSATMFKLQLFEECVEDIDRALENNFPDDLRTKLIHRRQEALKRKSLIDTAMSHEEIPHISNYEGHKMQWTRDCSDIHHQQWSNLDPRHGSTMWIENSNGLDYGSGMAHSFFHGYLKLVIHRTDTENNDFDLEESMQIYEANNGVTFQCYKLFILIPKSLHCPTSLMNENNPAIEESRSLPKKKLTVAGVRNRVYKNSVYKIKNDKGKRIYVVAEYATPLKTFKDVITSNGKHSNVYRKHKDIIVLQFYRTLKQILKENESCSSHCQLIFYDDQDDQGNYYDVGQILLDQLNCMKKNISKLKLE